MGVGKNLGILIASWGVADCYERGEESN